MTPQEAINRAREFSKANKEVLPVTTEAIDTLISKLDKQLKYPTKEMFQFAMWLTGHDLDTILQMYQDFNKWKESNNKNK